MPKQKKTTPDSELYFNSLFNDLNKKLDTKASESFVQKISDNLDERINNLEGTINSFELKEDERHNKVMELLTWLISQFKKFDEEHTILSHTQAKHGDRLDKLEKVVFRTS